MPVNLKEITKFKANNGGIYALAMDIPLDRDRVFPIKIGRTTDYLKRLNDYHLCFNAGYRMIGLLPLKNTCPIKLRYKRTKELEKLAFNHDILKGKKKSYPNRASRGSEWYEVTINDIHKLFKSLHNDYKHEKFELTASPMLEFDDDWTNKFNTYSATIKSTKLISSTPEKIKISLTAKVKTVKPKTIKPKKKIKMNMKKVSSIKKIKDILKQ